MIGTIVYSSKYGATRQYAEWLAADTKLPVVKIGESTIQEISNDDFVVIGTPVYFSKFLVRKWLNRHAKRLQGKKIFVFVVNAAASGEQAKRDRFVTMSVPGELRNHCEFSFFPGG